MTIRDRDHGHLRSGQIRFHARARADEVAVAEDVVHAADRGPELPVAQAFHGESGLLPAIRAAPAIGGHLVGGVRRVLEQVVLGVLAPLLDLHDLVVDGDHRVAEAVELALRLRFGGLDHERARHRPAERRSVEAVIHEPFRDVLGGDRLEAAEVEDALVGDEAVRTVERREVGLEPLGDVVRVEDRDLRGVGETGRTHHRDIHPRDRADAGAAPRRGADGTDGVLAAEVHDRVPGQERDEMFGDADRADTGPLPHSESN